MAEPKGAMFPTDEPIELEPSSSGAIAVDRVTASSNDTATLTIKDTDVTTSKIKRSPEGPIVDKLRSSGEKLAGQAGEKARGLVSQGLERAADALANVSKMVGDTADGIDDRLGADYGNYARKTATALDKAGRTLGNKDPDELIDDTRNFVRNSPGIALAGAAVIGFVVARLFKSGLASGDDDRG